MGCMTYSRPPTWRWPAFPARAPTYVIPCSHLLDPPYSQMPTSFPPWWRGQWPFPRSPWPLETESRAPGTGLITSRPC